jgi:hypothetical protein
METRKYGNNCLEIGRPLWMEWSFKKVCSTEVIFELDLKAGREPTFRTLQ